MRAWVREREQAQAGRLASHEARNACRQCIRAAVQLRLAMCATVQGLSCIALGCHTSTCINLVHCTWMPHKHMYKSRALHLDATQAHVKIHAHPYFALHCSEIRGQLAMLMGGRAAESLTCASVTTGAMDDIRRATELAARAVSVRPRCGQHMSRARVCMRMHARAVCAHACALHVRVCAAHVHGCGCGCGCVGARA